VRGKAAQCGPAKGGHFCGFVFCKIQNYPIIKIRNKIETKQNRNKTKSKQNKIETKQQCFHTCKILRNTYENNRDTKVRNHGTVLIIIFVITINSDYNR